MVKTYNKFYWKEDCQCYGEDGYPLPDHEECAKKKKAVKPIWYGRLGRGLSGMNQN